MKNYSRQREDLLSILKNSKSHPTAEELYNSIKEKIPSVSRGTVYRNLKDLVDEGYIIKISMADGADRYDYIHKKHNHIICKYCGMVKDFEYDFDLKNVKLSVIKQMEMDPLLDGVIVYGICRKCKEKNRRY